MPKVLVVGGGAAGMMAAISATNQGAEVVILERNNRVGKKILATGNGRCNYTNINLSISNYHGNNPKFAYSCISKFGVDKTLDFFEQLGITPAVEDNGKVFPLSFQSSSVLDVLRFELEDLGIEVLTDGFVTNIKKEDKFQLTLMNGRKIYGDRVILATGGNAAPNTGSDGNGYTLAKNMGHSIVDVFPGLVQLKLEGNIFKQVDGVKFVGTAGLYRKNQLIKEDRGDILFTNYGISGPPILQLSRTALEYLNNGKDIELKVSIIDTKTEEELYDYLIYRFGFMAKKTIERGLIGLINKRLILPILKEIRIDKNKQIAHLSNEEVRRLSGILTDWRFNISGSKSFKDAQITAGGIDTNEIDSSTMESKLVEGLYFAGEIVDIDGDCGGFNLQWAWSSGYIAGENSALS
ncbi:NAD(P)/FAD-dependent oxidoreductase [Clostridium sp. Cult3]|uniref:NAD(P)/FAD-dependent oxidoreductase n=1 Tax=Clostridium sp. Cult3 TaxID=2079004 RepID=UPI001F295451|nr:NAD(P)/FAD-dependent oxidoreductase [Clostridium sp. Cult3]MCF6461441.1 aminoacetone oxidase family FAD-binding enzyme [Clostridium sp. Cult3]